MKHKLLFTVLGFILSLFFFQSCNSDEGTSPVLLSLTHPSPSSNILVIAEPGDAVPLSFKAEATTGTLTNLAIYSREGYAPENIDLDSSFNRAEFRYNHIYNVREDIADSTDIVLIFEVLHSSGELYDIAKRIRINGGAILEGFSGLTMYSHHSGKESCFNLQKSEVISILDSAKDISIDFADDTTTVAVNADSLSRTIISLSDIEFVQFNDFDFAKATYGTIGQAYNSGSKSDRMVGIKTNDIYLFGRKDEPLGAIQFTGVNDEEGKLNDSYIFGIKQLKSPD